MVKANDIGIMREISNKGNNNLLESILSMLKNGFPESNFGVRLNAL